MASSGICLKGYSALQHDFWYALYTPSTPQLPFTRPQMPSNGDHKALNRATLGGAGPYFRCWALRVVRAPSRSKLGMIAPSSCQGQHLEAHETL